MTFIYSLSLSSRATGPNTRVPLISPAAFRRTQALSSNLMYEPSFLRTAFLVLTTTALETVPFFALPCGVESLIVTTILSPTEAYLLLVPPRTLITSTSFAPVLSATFNLYSVCNIT